MRNLAAAPISAYCWNVLHEATIVVCFARKASAGHSLSAVRRSRQLAADLTAGSCPVF